jgi:hypothetical protein
MQIEPISQGGRELNEAPRARGTGLTVLSACSACAGDYEDPDRTVGTADDAEDDVSDGAPCGAREEFPAEE